MNRRLLILPVVGAAALAGTQFLGGGSELPPEPVFPTVANQADQGWTVDDWSVNRFVDDPFAPSTSEDDAELEDIVPGLDLESDEGDVAEGDASSPTGEQAGPTTTTPSPVSSTPATTTTPPPTTTARDLSQAPPLADDGSGVDLPEIDDLPDPLNDGDDR